MLTKPKNPIGEPLQAERMGDGNLHFSFLRSEIVSKKHGEMPMRAK